MTKLSVEAFIDDQKISSFQLRTLFLCFLIVAIDGFDTAAVGYVAPALSKDWGITPAQLTPLMMVGLFGLMMGAFLFGPLSDRFGRKKLLLGTVAIFGVTSLLSGFVNDMTQLIILRFATGLGLGGAMPNAITLASEFCPKRKRATLVTIMFCGFTVGSAAGGFVAKELIPALGWRSVLVAGGIAPLLLIPVLVALLPESVRFLSLKNAADSRIKSTLSKISGAPIPPDFEFDVEASATSSAKPSELFANGMGLGTTLLWVTFFMSLLIVYLVMSWLPLVLGDLGIAPGTALMVALMFHVGGTIGAIILGILMDRFDENRVLAASYFVAALCIVTIGFVAQNAMLAGIAVFAAGFGVAGAQVGINALASGYYPTIIRATGVSWANAIGRSGSILGALFGGLMLSFGWSVPSIFAVVASASVIAAFSIYTMGKFRP